MVKVLAACGNGMGSSMVIKMKVENALRKLNQTDFTVNSCSVGEAKGLAVGYDIVIASLHLIQELEGRTNGKLIGLDNLMDDKEITEKLSQALQQKVGGGWTETESYRFCPSPSLNKGGRYEFKTSFN